jgi:hypothetical protein
MLSLRKSILGAAIAVICTTATAQAVLAQGASDDRYTLCAFRPQAPSCEAVYQQALHDQSPVASSVKAAFEGYGRYVRNANGALTDNDRQYLAANGIRLPDLTSEDQAGLHAVLNDPALQKDADARRIAVNNFLGHAVQAELYCGFNSCKDIERMATAEASASETR